MVCMRRNRRVGTAHQIGKNVLTPEVGTAHHRNIIAQWDVSAMIAIAIDSDSDSELDFVHLTNKRMPKPLWWAVPTLRGGCVAMGLDNR